MTKPKSIAARFAAGESITRLAWEYAATKQGGSRPRNVAAYLLSGYEFEAGLRKVEAAIRRAKKGKKGGKRWTYLDRGGCSLHWPRWYKD
jgi:hypothetical protein